MKNGTRSIEILEGMNLKFTPALIKAGVNFRREKFIKRRRKNFLMIMISSHYRENIKKSSTTMEKGWQ